MPTTYPDLSPQILDLITAHDKRAEETLPQLQKRFDNMNQPLANRVLYSDAISVINLYKLDVHFLVGEIETMAQHIKELKAMIQNRS